MRGIWRRWVLDVRDRVDAESAAHTAGNDRRRVEREAIVVFATVAACLFLARFAGTSGKAGWVSSVLAAVGADELAAAFDQALRASPNARFNRKVFWAVGQTVCYGLVPILVVKLVLRQRLRDYAVRVRDTWQYARSYALMFALLLPVVVAASYSSGFQAKYPLYKPPAGADLWPQFFVWELLYAAQFAAVEFFFRGFMIHGLKRRLGYAAIYAMVIPYMMIHFTKPPAEAAGSVIAGFVLGSLSLKSGSIWWGVALHVGVAVAMDLLALLHRGVL